MRPHVGDWKIHESSKTDRATHEVGEDEESSTVDTGQAICGDTVHRARHGELTNSEVEVTTEGIGFE